MIFALQWTQNFNVLKSSCQILKLVWTGVAKKYNTQFQSPSQRALTCMPSSTLVGATSRSQDLMNAIQGLSYQVRAEIGCRHPQLKPLFNACRLSTVLSKACFLEEFIKLSSLNTSFLKLILANFEHPKFYKFFGHCVYVLWILSCMNEFIYS